MNQLTVLLIKFISCLLAFAIGLDLFFDATIGDIVSFSLLVTVVSYLLGDKILLPIVGNRKALIVDFFLAYMIVWIFGSVLLENYLQIAWGSILSASLISVAEMVVHRVLHRYNDTKEKMISGFNPKMVYGMEMAEEQDPRDKK